MARPVPSVADRFDLCEVVSVHGAPAQERARVRQMCAGYRDRVYRADLSTHERGVIVIRDRLLRRRAYRYVVGIHEPSPFQSQRWWWAVYEGDGQTAVRHGIALTKRGARRAARGAARELLRAGVAAITAGAEPAATPAAGRARLSRALARTRPGRARRVRARSRR